MSDRLLCIDLANVAFRSLHGYPEITNSRGEAIQAAYGTGATILRLARVYQPTHLVIALDAPRHTLERAALNNNYKGHRPKADDEIKRQLDLAREVCGALDGAAIGYDSAEADDICASLAQVFPDQVIIASGDRDLLSAITADARVGIHLLGPDRLVDWQGCIDLMGVSPNRVPDYKALVGDSSDGYSGVPGIGKKGALSLLEEYENAECIFERHQEITGRVGKSLQAGLESGRLSLELARLRHDIPLVPPNPWRPDITLAKTRLEELEMPNLARELAAVFGEILPLSADERLF